MVSSIIIGISGPVSSGKSTLATALAKRLKCKVARFGDYVRNIASERGLELTRENLQKVGEELAQDKKEFCQSLLKSVDYQPRENLIIEGIRHADIAIILKELLTPALFSLVYLSISETSQQERFNNREKQEQSLILTSIESHSTEIEVKNEVYKLSDFKVDSNLTTEKQVDQIIQYIS